jgi:ribose 5-phosphate isomerase B
MKIYFAADHAGFELKQHLLNAVRGWGYEVEDCGAFKIAPQDDYPDIIAGAVRKLVADVKKGIDSRAILIGASGQGEAMAANRFRGVRCAVYYGSSSRQTDATGHTLDLLESVRAHNDGNALSLGARFMTAEEAANAVKRWLETAFSREERHARRNRRLDELA